jgi:hypothetical protein
MTERLRIADEVAEHLSVPVSWVRESTRSGAMPCRRAGPIQAVSALHPEAYAAREAEGWARREKRRLEREGS